MIDKNDVSILPAAVSAACKNRKYLPREQSSFPPWCSIFSPFAAAIARPTPCIGNNNHHFMNFIYIYVSESLDAAGKHIARSSRVGMALFHHIFCNYFTRLHSWRDTHINTLENWKNPIFASDDGGNIETKTQLRLSSDDD